ncbi:MAG TPA: type I DNA topoisomerase [Mucilaginibacter sp.]|jgi:DNA topoisomerase-1|nr:type I DNA topoisomerase [Mucilaginibacter sp.]
MAKNLIIVESPGKVKTIEGYLGKDFTVKSSYGHIRDLVKSDDAIDIANNFKQKYEVPADKKQIVSELKKLAKEADMVWLASDEDREGEAISWHLFDTLDLKDATTKRIVFHEITKPAILRAIETPRKIDYNLVNAQQARRVLDRLVGFELSPVLWKKVKPSLSAGRVQSVAVRLIVDREREINKFTSEAAFKITAVFGRGKDAFRAELPERFSRQEDAEKFLRDCIAAIFKVNSLETRPTKRAPAAPFTTSTLQQEASRKLGFSVSRTMQVAQKLYESGHITYMRTDSVNLSDTALNAAADEIVSAYGQKYHQQRKYKTKSASAQEAHEAIRPTYFNQHSIKGDSGETRLYDLIWKRAIASQMSEAQFEKTTAKIGISSRKEELVANGEVMKFDGFLKVYLESSDDDEDNLQDGENAMLPPLTKGQLLELQEMLATERFSRPSARYTEASLVKKLEELGIGRPSTYAPTISTIQNRGYVVKEEREGKQRVFRVLTLKGDKISHAEKTENTGAEKGKLFPTDIGSVVNDFLVQYFVDIVDFNFTATVEKQFDDIAQGLTEWTDMIRGFYTPFHKEVESTVKTADKATGERDLGIDPTSGKKVSVRIGRFGPFVQVGESNGDASSEEKPLYASLRAGQSIETISLDDAMELFKLPKKAGIFEEKEMTVAIGKFGPYVRHNNAFYSLPKEIDPLQVTEAQAIDIIVEKRKKDAERVIKAFDEDPTVKVLNGRFGPYIEFGKSNVKIPRGKDPKSLTFEECKELAAAAEKEPKKPVKKFVKKK